MALSEQDIIIEPTDLYIVNGDFAIISANEQNIKHILISSPGNYLLTPTLGVDAYKLQNAAIVDFRPFVSKVKSELKADGYEDIKTTGEQLAGTDNAFIQVSAERVTIAQRATI